MLTRRRFLVAGGGAALAMPGLVRAQSGLDLSSFGAAGDGTTDDGPALGRAIAAAIRAGAPLTIGKGRYLISTPIGSVTGDDQRPALRSGRIELIGAGVGATALTAPPLASRTAGVAPLSRAVLRAVGVERLHLRDLTLDGGVASAESRSTEGFGADDAAALLEVEGCDDVVLERVVTTRNRHVRIRGDRSGRLIGRSGPVLAIDCSNVRVDACGSVFPAFTEGWWLFDCRHVTVSGFRHVGPERFDPAATTTPLNIFGPRTEGVTIRGCDIRNALGSSLNLGGRGRFKILDNRFSGVIAENPGAVGRDAARPHEGAFGKGIDLGSEHQEDYFPEHPTMRDVVIAGNRFDNLFSYSVSLAKTASCPIRNLVFRDNHVAHGFRGLMAQGVEDSVFRDNTFERIVRYAGADRPAFGSTMSVEDCRGITIEKTLFDGSKRPRLGRGMGEGTPDVGLWISRSSDVTLRANRFVGFDAYQLLADVGEGDDLRFSDFELVDNSFEAAAGRTSQPVAMRLGRSDDRRLARVTRRGDRIDPALRDRVSVFAK